MSDQARREFERANILTLSDGSIWRYANIGNTWECVTGDLHAHFAITPVLAGGSPLTAADELKVREVKYVSRLCTVMSLAQARADWKERGIKQERGNGR